MDNEFISEINNLLREVDGYNEALFLIDLSPDSFNNIIKSHVGVVPIGYSVHILGFGDFVYGLNSIEEKDIQISGFIPLVYRIVELEPIKGCLGTKLNPFKILVLRRLLRSGKIDGAIANLISYHDEYVSDSSKWIEEIDYIATAYVMNIEDDRVFVKETLVEYPFVILSLIPITILIILIGSRKELYQF